jgi:drug/metabolite transporter (DMT)-like permease
MSSSSTNPAERPGFASGHTSHVGSRALLLLSFAAIYIVWGSTYFAIRVGIESFPPFILAGIRHMAMGLLLFPFAWAKTRRLPSFANWRTAGVSGFLLLFVGNGGVSWAEQTVPSGIAALLVATVSFWLVIAEWLRPGGTPPVGRVVLGILIGFGGMLLLVGPASWGGGQPVSLTGAGVLVFASLAWACGSLYSKHGEMPASPMMGVALQCLVGGATLLLAGLFTGEFHVLHFAAVSWRSWLAISYLILFGSGIGFSAYIYVLHHSTPARVGTYAFVNPVVALLLGWLFGGETLALRTFLAAAIILTSVILVITAPHPSSPASSETLPAPAPGEA